MPTSLTFTFDAPTRFTSVGLIGGYVKVDPLTGVDRFPQNHRVRQVQWTFDEATTVTQNLADSREMQTLPVDITATSVTMQIVATYPPVVKRRATWSRSPRSSSRRVDYPIDGGLRFSSISGRQRVTAAKDRPAADTGAIRSRVGGRRRSARGHRRAHRRHSDARHRHAGADPTASRRQRSQRRRVRRARPARPCASSAASAMTISVTSWSVNFPLTASTCGCNAAAAPVRWSCSSVLTESGRCCPTAAQLSNSWNSTRLGSREWCGCTCRRTRCSASRSERPAGR